MIIIVILFTREHEKLYLMLGVIVWTLFIVKSFTDIVLKNIYCFGTLQNYKAALFDRQINELKLVLIYS